MTTGIRQSGFSALGPISWGAHLCHFYESRSELLSVTADFLHAGLVHREAGVWVAPALLGADKARHMLRRTSPALGSFIDSGQLQILDGAQFYAPSRRAFDGDATVGLWSAAIHQALERGYEGLRVAGDAICDETTDWVALLDYEGTLKQRLADRPVLGLCTYCVEKLRAAQAREIERLHDATIESPRTRFERASAPTRHVANDSNHAGRAAQIHGHGRVSGPTIGHEIRNAITPLNLVAHLLATQYSHDEQLSRYALLLSRQASLLGQLAQELTAPAQTEAAGARADIRPAVPESREQDYARIDVDELLAHCAQVAEAGAPGHAPIQLLPRDASLRIAGDFGKLTQVFVNLMANALKYSAASECVRVVASRAGRSCYITVSDNGIGIARRDLVNIFRPYERALPQCAPATDGLGLGLSIVREIVTSMGGTVEAFSNGPGSGSQFVVRLPLAQMVVPSTSQDDIAQDARILRSSEVVCTGR